MPRRSLARIVGGVSVVTVSLVALSTCSFGDAGESTRATEAMQTPSVVTSEDIPSDVYEDSWARLPLLRRESLDADGQRAFDVIVNPDSR